MWEDEQLFKYVLLLDLLSDCKLIDYADDYNNLYRTTVFLLCFLDFPFRLNS